MPTITITLTDAELTATINAFQADVPDETVDAAYIKAKLVGILTSRVRNHDEKVQTVSYTRISPR